LATGRVESTLNKLRKNPGDLVNYHKEIQQLIDSKFVEEANMDYEELHTYLPHHPVYRVDKTTTKIRPVFDGAAKTKFGPSLNDVLEAGPNLNPDLLSVLMRFRKNKIAWIADIEKAFLNIALHPEDAEAIRFLWPKEPEIPGSPLIAYKWKRVPFGLSPSPFLLRVTINKHFKSLKSRFPETIEQLEKNLYVDDYLGGANDLSVAKQRIEETDEIFSCAQLNMRSWATNSEELRQHLKEKGLTNQVVGLLSPALDGQQKVLGIRWDTRSDSFQFDPTSIIQAVEEVGTEITKRKILSISARIFDPIGFLAPTVLLLKIIYQKLWEKEIGWDQTAPAEIQKSWKLVMTGLIDFTQLKIPRWIGLSEKIISNEIHVFGDASEAAYGAVAYARLQRRHEDPYVILLASKTRIAPLPKKKVTLPRLELLSSLLAVRLGEVVKAAMQIHHWKTIYWSDSLVSLGWIRGEPNKWKPFVRNQVETIRKFSQPEWWRHCPGLQNPADLASRGAPAPALVTSTLWWNGPIWLREDEREWPDPPDNQIPPTIQSQIESEARRTTVSVTAAITTPTTPIEWNLDRISTWNRLVRRTAWISRFLSRSQGKLRPPGPELKESIKANGNAIQITRLSREELDEAELTIYRQLQRERYPKAFESLQQDNTIQPKEKIAALLPIWDQRDRLIRVQGRVSLA